MRKAKKVAAGILAMSVLPFSAVQADTLFGIYAGAGTWQQEYSGDVTSGISSVDIEDSRMRIRRSHHPQMQLTVQIDVVDEAALSAEQRRILEPW